jgi:hypothetical protein
MTDIVERLRLFVPHCEDPNDYLEDELLFLKAADEIERLRGALREISTRNFPEGTATLELRKIARAALGEKE